MSDAIVLRGLTKTFGETVAVLETTDTFARVRTPDRYTGWIPRTALVPYPDAASPRYARAGRLVEVTSLMANLYRDPDVTSARPRVQAPLATRLEVAAEGPSSRWLSVRLPSRDTAWVQRGDVREVDASTPPARGTPLQVIATARPPWRTSKSAACRP